MNPRDFIARRLSFKGKMAVWATAISFLVIILSVAIAGGFRREIRNGVSSIAGDIRLTDIYQNYYGDAKPIDSNPPYLDAIKSVKGVKDVSPAIYRAGIVKTDEGITGVMFKGVPVTDSLPLAVRIPSKTARMLRLDVGDDMTAYFVGEKVRARKFKVSGIYDSMIEDDENLIVYASIDDLRRLEGWTENEASALEVTLEEPYRSNTMMIEKSAEIGSMAYPLVATSAVERYGQLFDWLDLIDFNVLAILVLMTLVAAFNMISGLLILLFRSISTIGTLKSLGMNDRSIAGVFLKISSRIVLKGMLIGNAIAAVFCIVQSSTHFIKLDPANYFVSYVPVQFNLLQVIMVDGIAYIAIMLILLIPSLFISGIDPSETVRVK